MARLTALPAIDIIRGFKGTIDFYLWKGLACARKWPYTPKSKRTDATKAAAALFGAISADYRLLAPLALAAFQEAAKTQPRTARDLYMSAVYGHLHEASMSDFLTLLTECRDFLDALTAILGALGTVDTDYLQANVLNSALPAGAATFAEQESQTAALALLDQLRGALRSVNTDNLQVRGMDQLFSYQGTLEYILTAALSGAGGYQQYGPLPAGPLWILTAVTAVNYTAPVTAVRFGIYRAGTTYPFGGKTAAIAKDEHVHWNGLAFAKPGDYIRAYYPGAGAGDTCYSFWTGHKMTKEA